MSKYIKVFDTIEEYNAYSGGTSFVSPNVSYVKGNDTSYYDNNEIKHYTEPCNNWIEVNEESGTTFEIIQKYIKSVIIPSGVTSIGNNAFSGCQSLTSIEIPSGVTSIGNNAFSGCQSLTSIEIPSGVTSISYGCFYNCQSLTSIEIPSGVTSIGGIAFQNCSLTSIEIPSGVTSIGGRAFQNCSGLTSIETQGNIGEYCFLNCYGLTSVTLSNGVKSIGEGAFSNCSGLTSIEIPSSITTFNSYALTNLDNLISVTIYSTTPPVIGWAVFGGNYPIYVPSESIELYKSATNWSAYADRIQAIPTN